MEADHDSDIMDTKLMNEIAPDSLNESAINQDSTSKKLKHPADTSKSKGTKLHKKIREEAKEDEPETARDEIEEQWKELEGDY